jgi:D-alanyl-D-alanine carboxypeptidase
VSGMNSAAAACAAILALCVVSNSGSARVASGAALEACIRAEVKSADFSGVVSIAQSGGGITVANGFLAGPGSAPMSPNAQFNIGSAGKMWTGVAIGQLIDAKKMSLDDAIGRYVDGLTPDAAAVTIRHLLTHSGGLGNYFVPENIAVIKSARNLSDLKPLVAGSKPAFAPGARSEYSNTGFLLLGLAIEKATGQRYGDYLQTHVFAPADMTLSGMMPAGPSLRAVGMTNWPDPEDALPAPPQGAQAGPPPGPGRPQLPPPGPLRRSAEAEIMGSSAGGGYSTAADMQRFYAALFAGKLTSTSMLHALTSPQIMLLPARRSMPSISYGFGFSAADYKGRAWVGHNGGLPGGNVATMTFPKDRTTLVVMANRDPPSADEMMRKIQSMVFDAGACSPGPAPAPG